MTRHTIFTILIFFTLQTCNSIPDPGQIGTSQEICSGSVPEKIQEIKPISGMLKPFNYQWQQSTDTIIWTDIDFANEPDFLPTFVNKTTFFRRNVIDSGNNTYSSNSVVISVTSKIADAELSKDLTITTNSSVNFSIELSGGTPPFTICYSLNGNPQPVIQNFLSGDYISSGILSEGVHKVQLKSIVDAHGCIAENLETTLIITVKSDPPGVITKTNKAVVLINSESDQHFVFKDYIKPYLDNFGIPYEIFNTASNDQLPPLNKYGLIIFGHKYVFQNQYPVTSIQSAVSSGTGLVSFDPIFFNNLSDFVRIKNAPDTVFSNQISLTNTDHYITKFHETDEFSPHNNVVDLINPITVIERSCLKDGIRLAEIDSSGISLLQIAEFGEGRVVHWTATDWMLDSILGPVFGMDDLLWRGIVWAARKPFVLKGMPPFITLRVDDVQGRSDRTLRNFVLRKPGNKLLRDFEWIKICNTYGIIPWCGTFNDKIPKRFIPTLKNLLDNGLANASPHAFASDDFIYFNHFGESGFDPAKNVARAKEFYEVNGLKISNLIFPHFYEISPDALEQVKKMGIEFIGTHMDAGKPYMSEWINCGPYRINREGNSRDGRPVYYADYLNWDGYSFFNCLTEIRDDSPYKFEWFPTNDVLETSARGIRHLRRAISSMVLPSLYTHEYEMRISPENWKSIMRIITENLTEYDPEYVSLDYAVKYVRARNNITLKDVIETDSLLYISYSGKNDLETRCVLFTENDKLITSKYVILPQNDNFLGTVYLKKY